MAVNETAQTRERLGFLLARHGQIVNARMRVALGVTGLTPRHGYALTQLAENGPMSQQALIEALAVDPSILVAILNDLEREGLAERRRDPADRRRHIVEMSRQGAAALRKIERAAAGVEEDMFADLDQAERAQLRDLLSRLRTTCDDTAEACAAERDC
jgi:DNA-binding MarR family transcriptional regulator